jgi:hypothetical protein
MCTRNQSKKYASKSLWIFSFFILRGGCWDFIEGLVAASKMHLLPFFCLQFAPYPFFPLSSLLIFSSHTSHAHLHGRD